ncbi:MAG: 16S rRNA (cytosine(1402)-N(4))-methyltransferase RsmH [Saprospiraceae bacterium]|nr:16S rRNA (cytosine(1402)-N(4))-methyltransferase RsmH [Saprospiraceae bacterium]
MSDKAIYVHRPVLLQSSVDALITDKSGIYIDATFGGGGHSKEILNRLDNDGKLFAFDRDADALENQISDKRLHLIKSDFRYLKKYLRYFGVTKIHGLLADLGVSSWHFDIGQRGFSFQQKGPLDMRMNAEQELTAEKVLTDYSEEELFRILTEYGEITNARPLVQKWVRERKALKINTCESFADWLSPFVYGKSQKFLAQVFQALRIEVNGELESLKELLSQSEELISKGGRIVVISYHSLEDRIVKSFLKGEWPLKSNEEVFGKKVKTMKQINKEIIVPDHHEVENNSRSRSAKMRVGEKQI